MIDDPLTSTIMSTTRFDDLRAMYRFRSRADDRTLDYYFLLALYELECMMEEEEEEEEEEMMMLAAAALLHAYWDQLRDDTDEDLEEDEDDGEEEDEDYDDDDDDMQLDGDDVSSYRRVH